MVDGGEMFDVLVFDVGVYVNYFFCFGKLFCVGGFFVVRKVMYEKNVGIVLVE